MNTLSRLITLTLITVVGSTLAAPVDQEKEAPDFIRFTNYDTLHGSFHSFSAEGTVIWKTPEALEPIHFSTTKIHRISLNKGKAHQPLKQTTNIQLINGDIIPGEIISINSATAIIKTEHLNTVKIPRNSILKISPSPFGGKLFYHGPLNSTGWKTTSISADQNKEQPDHDSELTDPNFDWQHIGSAYYSGTNNSRLLIREHALPETCNLSFKLGWRNSLYTRIFIHADFAPPERDEKIITRTDPSAVVGNAYLLTLTSHNATLSSFTFGTDGKPITTRLQGSLTSLQLSEEDSAVFELRLDKTKRNIILFINGDFKAKWNLGDTYAGKGNHLAFKNDRNNKSPIRVSDITISHWNRMKDSANSMQSSQRDIILLNNGLDRYSGKFKEIREQKVYFQGSYDNELVIPMDEVTEITLATHDKNTAKVPPKKPDDTYFYISPYGRITGIPSQGPDGTTKLQHSIIGEIMLDTRYINIIDFSHKNNLLDTWDDNF